jgi:hypothetical protein
LELLTGVPSLRHLSAFPKTLQAIGERESQDAFLTGIRITASTATFRK